MTDVNDLMQIYATGDQAAIARFELRGCLKDQQVEVSEDEFEAVLAEQTEMRAAHDRLSQSLDRGECTPEDYLDRLEVIQSASMVKVRDILGPDRYRQFFGSDATENVLPIDREAFLASQADSNTRRLV